jgi:hypothetical protein
MVFLGRPKLLVEVVHKLLLLRIPTRRSHRVWDLEISGTRSSAALKPFCSQLMLLNSCALGEHCSGGIWNFGTSSFKCYVDHPHMYVVQEIQLYKIGSIFFNHPVLCGVKCRMKANDKR